MLKQGLGLNRGVSNLVKNTVVSLDGVNDRCGISNAVTMPSLFDHVDSGASKLTICGWFKFPVDPEETHSATKVLFSNGDATRHWSFSMAQSASNYVFKLMTGNNFSASSAFAFDPRDNIWHHYAMTYDGSLGSGLKDKDRLSFYLDGTSRSIGLDGNATIAAFTEADDGLGIGTYHSAFTGSGGPVMFDEIFYVKFYKASDAEILDIYNKGVTSTSLSSTLSSKTRGYWRIDKNDSTSTVNDHIGSVDLTPANMSADGFVVDGGRPSDE